ncbi:MAG: hypothetical protein NVS9B15_18890 [Acidobacteriaceae bacterium]
MGALVLTWLSVSVWLVVIAIESTEGMGAAHTLAMLYSVLRWMHMDVSWQTLDEVNHVLRKSGHFVGYGILGILFVRAWAATLSRRNTAQPVLRRAVLIGIFCTLVVAGADEFHQTFLPGRTGSIYDVMLDTAGACLMSVVLISHVRRAAEASSVKASVERLDGVL